MTAEAIVLKAVFLCLTPGDGQHLQEVHMNNYTASSLNRGFYSKPRTGYPIASSGAINRSAPAVVVKEKGRDAYRPAINSIRQTARA